MHLLIYLCTYNTYTCIYLYLVLYTYLMIDPYVFTCIHEQKEIIAMHTCHMCVACVCRTILDVKI